jgi:hypothetical protein
MRARLAATLPLIAVACGDNAAPTSGATAGSRLALYGYILDDGTEQVYPYDWYDRERGAQCVRQQWSDGATYCTPFSTAVVYSDANCTAEVARIAPSLTIPIDYARVLFATSNGALLSRLRVLGDPIAVTDFYYSSEAGTCTPHAISDNATFRTITDQSLTAAAFVRIRRLTDDGGGRFVGVRDVGDDGMVVPIGFHDNDLGIDCAASGFANTDTATCKPLNVAPAAYFTDPTCQTPAFSSVYAGSSDDTIELDTGACPRYFSESRTAPTALYDGTPGHCIASSPQDTYYAAGPELELGTVPRTLAAPAGSRYTPISLGDPALHVFDTFVHDNQLGLDCQPSPAGTCMPATAGMVASLFSDAGCTQPIELAYVPPECGVHATFVATDQQLFAIGAPFTATAYTISTADICAPTLPLPNLELRELGASIPVSDVGTVSFGVLP